MSRSPGRRPGAPRDAPSLVRLDRRLGRHADLLLVAALLLFVAGTAVHFVRFPVQRIAEVVAEAPVPEPQTAAPADPAGDEVFVGPEPGTDLARYEERRRDRLDEAAAATPDATALAVVSLTDYRTPDAVDELLAGRGLRVVAARYRLPADTAVRGRVPVQRGLRRTLVPVLAAEAEQARAQAQALDEMAQETDDTAFVEQFLADRDELLAAADAVGPGGCACVYAVEVSGPLRALADLARVDGVRLVDAAPPEAPAGRVRFVGLLPEERGVYGMAPPAPDG